jgi:nitrogen PTS system EIIA component
MKITEFFGPDCVVADLKSADKRAVLSELAAPLSPKLPGVAGDKLLFVLLEREKLGSTGIGEGVAIPHGKLPGIPALVASFGRSVKGVDFEAIDGKPTHLFFALFAPENSAGIHLKALARISRLFKNPGLRQAILGASDGPAIYRLIAEEDAKY